MPAPRYDVLKEFFNAETGEAVSVSPSWVLAVVRFRNPVTFSRANMKANSTSAAEAAEAAGDTLVITDDCLSVSTTSSKANHLKNLNASLIVGGPNYLAEVLPEDWLFAWMVHSVEKRDDLVRRIRRGEPCNRFDDGLKFVGRVFSMRKSWAVDKNTGAPQVRYNLVGNGFTQFNAPIFFDPRLAQKEQGINSWLKLNGIKNFLSKGAIDINNAIPSLVELLLGKGLSRSLANPSTRAGPGADQLQGIFGNVAGSEDEAEYAAIVPEPVGKLLGKTSRSKKGGVLAYADLLEAIYGVQRYTTGSFQPDGTESSADAQKHTPLPMMGKFLPLIPHFTGQTPIWGILGQYLNPTINEMFTCLRANAQGQVVPTFIVRQQPFSSSIIAVNDPTATPFLELPRWVIDPALIYAGDVGRAGALRFNFVQVSGQALIQNKNNSPTAQLVRNPPVRDDQDIRRSDLRPYTATVACDIEDQVKGPRRWQELVADFVMGQHLTFTGTIQCLGVQAPICEGDNLELDGVVYHIESVSHQASISQDGRKTFLTQLQLTHGVRSDEEQRVQGELAAGRIILEQADRLLYPGLYPDDQRALEPGLTIESVYD